MNLQRQIWRFVMMMLSIASFSPLLAQNDFWERCPGLEGGGYVSGFTVAPDGTIYTAGYPIYRSTDNGLTWKPITSLRGTTAIHADHAGTVYATPDENLYSSTDRGETWRRIDDVTFDGYSEAIGDEGADAFVNTMGGDLFAISVNAIYRSSSGRWKRLPLEANFGSVYSLGADSSGRILVGSVQGLFTIDEKADSQLVRVKKGAGVGSAAYTADGYWYCSDRGLICRTRQLNSSYTQWDTVYQHHSESYPMIQSISIAPAGNMYAMVQGEGILRSIDSGATWNFYKTPPVYAFSFSNTSDLLAGPYGAGVLRSLDSGRTWQDSFSGMKSLSIEDITVTPDGTLYVATNGRGVFRSNDQGTTWEPSFADKEYSRVYAVSYTAQGSLLVADSYIYRSRNEGSSWQTVTPQFNTAVLKLLPSRSGAIYANVYDKPLYKSTDDGASWEMVNVGGAEYIMEDSTGNLWHMVYKKLSRSSDGGITWKFIEIPAPATACYSIVTQPSGALVAVTDAGIMRSVDDGLTWNVISALTLKTTRAYSIVSVGDDNIVIGDSLMLSTNSGATWSSIPLPSSHPSRTNRIASDTTGYIYAATSTGVYRSREPQKLSSVPTVANVSENLHAEARNGMLYLRSNIAGSGSARVAFITLDGRRIYSHDVDLHDQPFQTVLPLPDLGSGVYGCTVEMKHHSLRTTFVVIH